ncbi:phosphotransferase [Pseudoalteromonas sp. MMG022]|uniref:phosphotransferase n=1 Tax=Pseudoalteromonas sp. MMG022 TaxID=2909978 RepID=UPI001F37592B|nr:phosphotransferase [Pseudoalteromonas sp. MMG022]MCF6435989.1 phosphotransferase [Pseudoalteromonas sp. MMG022]
MSIVRASHLESYEMKEQALIAKLTQLKPELKIYQLRPLNKGLSNENYWLDSSLGPLLLKLYRSHFPLSALKAQQRLAIETTVTQPVVMWHKEEKLALFAFAPEIKQSLDLNAILSSLFEIHEFQANEDSEILDIGKLLQEIDTTRYSFAECRLHWAVEKIASLPRDMAFCHNDLVTDNIIASSQGIKFIDFEYAGYNDVFFDLAALCCSFNLTVVQQSEMLDMYFSYKHMSTPEYATDKLRAYQIGYLLLSVQWYESRDYVELAAPLRLQLQGLAG